LAVANEIDVQAIDGITISVVAHIKKNPIMEIFYDYFSITPESIVSNIFYKAQRL
jgi:hypothetical protein